MYQQDIISRSEIKRRLSRNVRRLMQEKRVYISTLVNATGISRNTILNIRRGRHLPTLDNLILIARALDLPLDALIAPDPTVEKEEFYD